MQPHNRASLRAKQLSELTEGHFQQGIIRSDNDIDAAAGNAVMMEKKINRRESGYDDFSPLVASLLALAVEHLSPLSGFFPPVQSAFATNPSIWIMRAMHPVQPV